MGVLSLVRLGLHLPPRRPKTFSFLFECLCVSDRDCAHDFAMNLLAYRNHFDIVG